MAGIAANIDAGELMHRNVQLRIRVCFSRRFRVRWWVTLMLLWLAAFVSPIPMAVEQLAGGEDVGEQVG
jgi:hypothetical protein